MANGTANYLHNQIVYITWMVQFLSVGLGNGFVAMAIIRYEAIRDRKEYLVIFGLCLADFFNLASYFCAGVYRTMLLIFDQHDSLRSSFYCLLLPHNIGWLIFTPIASLMLVVVSMDRLTAVTIPLKYFGFNRHYAYALLAFAYGYCIAFGLIFVIIGVSRRNDAQLIAAPCYTYETFSVVNGPMAFYHLTLEPSYGILSVLLYTVLAIVYWRKSNSAIVPDEHMQEQERQFQRRVTKSVALSSLCTFWLLVVPSLFGYGFLSLPHSVTQWLWLLPNLNPGCNVIIFLKRQPEIMEALKAMIKCKQMPMDIRLWKANNNAL